MEEKRIPIWLSFFLVAVTPVISQSTISLELVHVDNVFRSPNATTESLLRRRLQSDAARFFKSPLTSGEKLFGEGVYVTRLGIGTPEQDFYMILDTGSNVIWLQCSPCPDTHCYSQVDPLFNPRESASFGPVGCNTNLCNLLLEDGSYGGCNQDNNVCQYQIFYADGSYSIGNFSTEMLTFRDSDVTHVMEYVALGCGYDNNSTATGFAGVLGLGRGELSFVNQAGSLFNKTFSYCLVNISSSSNSSFTFGELAIPHEMVFTPMLSNPVMSTYYYVGLTGISVDGKLLDGINALLFTLNNSTGKGGTIVDSGTTVTMLVEPAYSKLWDAVTRSVTETPIDNCFSKLEKVPTVALHFDDGANMTLTAQNLFFPADKFGTQCFAFASSSMPYSIIGNIQQQGFEMLFDLENKRIGFAPNRC